MEMKNFKEKKKTNKNERLDYKWRICGEEQAKEIKKEIVDGSMNTFDEW